MIADLNIKNTYVRRARLTPALIVAMPLALAVLSFSPDGLKSWSALWSLLAWTGGTALLAQVARDRGLAKEKELFLNWGGKPTSSRLRFAGTENAVLVARRHERLQKAIPDLHVPNEAEESADRPHADDVYDTCVRWLLEKTRDQKKFAMVFDANCDYGFRRNLWGMKPIAIAICVLGTILASTTLALQVRSGAGVSPISYGSAACIVALVLFWTLWCKPQWVKFTADAFAERLLATLDALDLSAPVPKRRTKKNGAAEA